MTEASFNVEVQISPRLRVRVSRGRDDRVEIRLLSLISETSGLYSPTKDGLVIPMAKAAEVAAAIRSMGRQK